MNINTGHLKIQIDKIVKEGGITIKELIELSGLSKKEMYSILGVENDTVHYDLGAKIAIATNRYFRILNGNMFFYKFKYIEMSEEEIKALHPEEQYNAEKAILLHYFHMLGIKELKRLNNNMLARKKIIQRRHQWKN